ncbi:UBX domain-containing protein 4 [Drosophila rhopaloa]|uniref:UBX domain-containing protein 4 n=3 Tax=Drosophila rhopaloa TaxID=1041015 RepID=A0ABM5J4N4_DRORH|nr:UBX domain-containing protein 4 [Drosophila rhopaloa]
MNWHTGNIVEAVAESKVKDAVFVVFIEGQDEMSRKLERFVDDNRVRTRLETSDFVAIKVQGNSSAYGQFLSLYKVVPIPSLFFIGKSGTPLEIATGITESAEELAAKIDKVLILAGKRPEPEAATSSSSFAEALEPNAVRSFAGADDSTSLGHEETQANQEEKIHGPETTSVSNAPIAEVEEPKLNPPNSPAEASFVSIPAAVSSSSLDLKSGSEAENTSVSPAALAAERRAAASKVEDSASTSGAVVRNLASSNLIPAVPLLTPAVPVSVQRPAEPLTESEERMTEVRNLLQEKRRERVEEEKRREKEQELRRRREGRETQTLQARTKEQEIKNMQEQIRRQRQEEQQTRERIRAQIAGDRAEQAHRVQVAGDLNSTTNSVAATGASNAITTESSVSSVDETRLQIRLPGGLQRTKTFPAGEVLATVRVYVRNELLAASDVRDFTLATSYPRREFQTEDEDKTLTELNLVPNAVVLVLTKEQVNRVVRSGGSLMTMLATVIWAMITPAAKAFDYIHKMGLRPLTQRLSVLMANIRWPGRQVDEAVHPGDAATRRNMDLFSLRPTPAPGYDYDYDEPSTSQAPRPTSTPGSGAEDRPTPQTQPGPGSTPPPHNTSQASGSQSQQFQQRPGGYQPPRYGDANIRRLQDTKKDEKDKATYNGNSTQQQ